MTRAERDHMGTIYDALRESHAVQRTLLRRLLRSRKDGQAVDEICRQITAELSAHASAEERFLYCPMMMKDEGLSSSRHALSEHHEIEELANDLRSRAVDDALWIAAARKLSETVHHHLKEEESGFFQLSGRLLSDKQKVILAGKYRRDYQRLLRKYPA